MSIIDNIKFENEQSDKQLDWFYIDYLCTWVIGYETKEYDPISEKEITKIIIVTVDVY